MDLVPYRPPASDTKENDNGYGGDAKRVIIFLDMDCYEVQLWVRKLRPDLIGKDVPIVVINQDDILLSVNYSAKSLGVERGSGARSLFKARIQCRKLRKKLVEIRAGERYGKVDTFLPQTESDAILKVLQDYLAQLGHKSSSVIIERSCRDEFYIDVTDLVDSYMKSKFWNTNNNCDNNCTRIECSLNIPSREETLKLTSATKSSPCPKYKGSPTTIMETNRKKPISGHQLFSRVQNVYSKQFKNHHHHLDEVCLVHGAIIAQTLIEIIRMDTVCEYQASAGIGHTKLEAKLACSRNKPEGITIMTESSHERLRKDISFQKLPGFGATSGVKIQEYFEKKSNTQGKGKSKKSKSQIGSGSGFTIEQLLRLSNNGADFQSVLNHLEVPKAESKAKQLLEYCHFVDPSPVSVIIHNKNFSTSMSFKNCNSWDEFDYKILNLAQDMEERILYYKHIGRMPLELVVKAEMVDNAAVSPGDMQNKLELGRINVSYNYLYNYIHSYCRENELHYDDILKIYLTAKSIVEE